MSKLRPCIILGIPTANKYKGVPVCHQAINEAKELVKKAGVKMPLKQALDCLYQANKQIQEKKKTEGFVEVPEDVKPSKALTYKMMGEIIDDRFKELGISKENVC